MSKHKYIVSTKADELLEYIRVMGYANPLNMTLVTRVRTTDTRAACTEVRRLLNNYLIKHGLVEAIPDKYGNNKYNADRFYRLSALGCDYFNEQHASIEYKSINPFIRHHDTQVIDFCTALYLTYKDTYRISFNRIGLAVPKRKTKYFADRVITFENKETGQQAIFYYEHETGERSPRDIYQDKIKLMQSIPLGVNEKFLFSVSDPVLMAFYRPWDFTEERKQAVYNHHKQLKKLLVEKKFTDSRFIIRPFCDYPDIKGMKLIS